jgi:uncharacterized damage-inducible protein DinB
MKSHVGRMLNAMIWADTQSLEAIREHAATHTDTLPLIGHVLAAEHNWLCRIENREARVAPFPTLSLAECTALAAENAREYLDFFEKLDNPSLATVVSYRNNKGDECSSTILDILTHVVIHGAYHRGQVARIIGRAGGHPPNTDYMAFVRSLEKA